MVKIDVNYQGQLRCEATHEPSGCTLQTDAPVDNHGLGESFSPTDLVATAMASCMATIMGIFADKKEIDLKGMTISVEKEMTSAPPRRIAKLSVVISMPIAESHPHAKALENAAMACPVHKSLHPEIDIPVQWKWTQ